MVNDPQREREPWDNGLKHLFDEAAQDIVSWLCQAAIFVALVSTDLRGRKISADILCEIRLFGQKCYLHIEFQKRRDPKMAQRLWEYNVRATLKYKCPVLTYVIYLVSDGPVPDEVFYVRTPAGKLIHRFDFTVIKLWEIPTADLLAEGKAGRVGMLPLLPLTREGKRREVVEQTIQLLAPEGQEPKRELLALSRLFASLSFGQEDQIWLARRFAMLEDIFKDTYAYKEIAQRGREEGRMEGREEGRVEGRAEGFVISILMHIQMRFKDEQLLDMARKRTAHLNETEALQLLARIITLPTAEEVRQALEEQV